MTVMNPALSPCMFGAVPHYPKPRIFKGGELWWCNTPGPDDQDINRFIGFGDTPKEAFEQWRIRVSMRSTQ